MRIFVGAILAALGLSSIAMAQSPSPDVIKAMAGEWLIVAQNGKPGCRVTLSTQTTIGGYVIAVPANCAARPWQ